MNTTVNVESEAMKFVLNGRTYDTATSSTVAINRGVQSPDYDNSPGDCELRYEEVVYRTARGNHFMHGHYTSKSVKGGKPVTTDEAKAMTPEEAVKWIETNNAVVVDAGDLPLPDEA